MRVLLFLFFFIIAAHSVLADGWRKGEMEVEVRIRGQEDKARIQDLHLNGDAGGSYAILYVIPDELKKIQEAGLEYKIRINDLNAYYRDFWVLDTIYHSYEEIIAIMDSLETQYPAICKKYYLGTSIGLREISALKISDSVDLDQVEPEIAFDGGIHGDEIGGPENLIRFARHLCSNYGTDPDITTYIDNREIWIYPMVNPDGRVFMSRYNMNGIDLNRDWGYMWDAWGNSPEAYSQTETRTLREFLMDHQFSIHTAFHSGLEMMLYPWYYRQENCPDYDAIAYLGMEYSLLSGYNNLPNYSGFTAYNTNGTAAESYYGVMGSYGFTMEISNDKQPPESQLMFYYNSNVEPMLMMIEKSGYGVKGIVRDAVTGNAVQSLVYINEQLPIYTDPLNGDYHKFLVPGTYSVRAVANGYETREFQNITVFQDSTTQIDFLLNPVDTAEKNGYRIISCQIPGNNWDDEGKTWAALGRPDSINYSIGNDGWVVIDMQEPVIDKPGNDIKIFEGDSSPEGFTLYASDTIDGPWNLVGSGYGTLEFDFTNTGILSARYFKIEDDGGGQSSGSDIGFDLDAISDLEHVDGIHLLLSEIIVDDSSANNNGVIDAGENVELLIQIINNGGTAADNISGHLQTSSSYINITQSNASFGSLASSQSSTGSFHLEADESTPIGEPVIFQLELSASGGSYLVNLEFEMNIGRYPVLIIDLDQNTNSGTVMQTVLADMEIPVSYFNTIPGDLQLYEIVFVCLGVFDNAYSLNITEGLELASYLYNGGKLYMEGGDTWYFDEATPLHPLFDIVGISDGFDDLGLMLGVDDTFTEGMNYMYDGDNSSIDRIIPLNDAFVLFYNQVPLYYTCIANENANYKTIGSVFEFGGLQDGSSTRIELMQKILDFFGGVPTGINSKEIKPDNNFMVYPNPFGQQANFEVDITNESTVVIEIYDALGRKIEQVTNKILAPGQYTFQWDPADHMKKGIYIYSIKQDTHISSGKLVLMK